MLSLSDELIEGLLRGCVAGARGSSGVMFGRVLLQGQETFSYRCLVKINEFHFS